MVCSFRSVCKTNHPPTHPSPHPASQPLTHPATQPPTHSTTPTRESGRSTNTHPPPTPRDRPAKVGAHFSRKKKGSEAPLPMVARSCAVPFHPMTLWPVAVAGQTGAARARPSGCTSRNFVTQRRPHPLPIAPPFSPLLPLPFPHFSANRFSLWLLNCIHDLRTAGVRIGCCASMWGGETK